MNLKKPKFWDYSHPNIFAYLLFPIAFIISFFKFIKKPAQKKFNLKTICVGNIYIGGTGKTSLCIKINDILRKKNFKSCFIKKYYKNQIDEQKLLNQNGKLFISKHRVEALKEAERNNYEIAILDDGLQDRSINCDINLICFNNINWIGNGMTIPAGPLRETINILKNHNHVFLNGNLENIESLKQIIYNINPNIIIHLGKYEPTNLDEFDKSNNYIMFSGIGNHQTFLNMLKNHKFNIVKNIEYPDHYNYKENDLKLILNEANKLDCKILTTEKDYLRLNNIYKNKIEFVKSELKIIDEEKFINIII